MEDKKKRILIGYVDGCGSSGIDTYLFNVATCLQNNGYDIDFLTYEMNNALKEISDKMGIGVLEVPGLKHPVKQLKCMKSLFKNKVYDVTYFNISEAFNSVGAIAASKSGISKVIIHSHSASCSGKTKFIKFIRRKIHSIFKNIVLRKVATDMVACSKDAAMWMFDRDSVKKGRCKIINNAIVVDKYLYNKNVRDNVRTEIGVENQFVLGHVSGFSMAKNVGFLIDIISEAKEIDPSVCLVLVGEGKDFNMVQEKVAKMQLEPYVKFLGRRNDVNDILQAFDVFVLPSLFEGAPVVAIEAQVSGLMVYLSDTVTDEVKLSEKCMYISLDETAKEWAEKILANKNYEREVSDFSQAKYCYDVKKQEKELLNMFDC